MLVKCKYITNGIIEYIDDIENLEQENIEKNDTEQDN